MTNQFAVAAEPKSNDHTDVPQIPIESTNTKIPAITRVHECRSAETGVGPSIASGNHKNENTPTDFADNATTNQARNAESDANPFTPVSQAQIRTLTTPRKITSPIRFANKAAKHCLCTLNLPDQCPINRNEIQPTHSQNKIPAKNIIQPSNAETAK